MYCICNCTSYVWKPDCHLPIYSIPIVGLELSLVSARRTVLSLLGREHASDIAFCRSR